MNTYVRTQAVIHCIALNWLLKQITQQEYLQAMLDPRKDTATLQKIVSVDGVRKKSVLKLLKFEDETANRKNIQRVRK